MTHSLLQMHGRFACPCVLNIFAEPGRCIDYGFGHHDYFQSGHDYMLSFIAGWHKCLRRDGFVAEELADRCEVIQWPAKAENRERIAA